MTTNIPRIVFVLYSFLFNSLLKEFYLFGISFFTIKPGIAREH